MTRYFVSYQPVNGHQKNFTSFDSLSARTFWILAHALDLTVISTWEGNE